MAIYDCFLFKILQVNLMNDLFRLLHDLLFMRKILYNNLMKNI